MAIKEHPIPQNITTYKFRLVGNMTLAQFLEVLGGIVIAFLFWKSPFYPVIKYPLVLFFGGAGALIAFVPIEERPLDVWLTAFVKKIYNPTLFIYQRTVKIPLYKTYQPKGVVNKQTPLQRSRSANLLLDNSFPQEKTINQNQLENYVKQLFASQTDIQVPVNQSQVKSLPQIRSLKIKEPFLDERKTTIKTIHQTKKQEKVSQLKQTPISTKDKPTSLKTNQIKILPAKKEETKPLKEKKPEKIKKQPIIQPEKTQPKTPKKPEKKIENNKQTFEKPAFDDSVPKPNKPNLPTGIVVDENNQPIAGVVVEIQDKESGLPVRVTKTNIIGQFILVTPLPAGKYVIIAEKDNYSFQPVEIELNNQIISPLKIQGKATTNG